MKLKKIVAGAVATALVASLAVTAGGASAATTVVPEKNAKLVVWDSKGTDVFWKALIPKFQKEYSKYNITVKWVAVDGVDQDDKFATDGPAGVAADVGVVPHDNLAKLVNSGVWLPNKVFGTETKANNVKAGVTAAKYNGSLYGFPLSIETYALYYNKKLVKTAPKSWADIKKLAQNPSIQNPADKKYAFMMDVANFYFNYAFFTAGGGYVFGKDGTNDKDIGLANAGSVSGLTFLKSLKSILPLKTADISYDVKESLFKTGKLAINYNGSWAIKGYRDAGIDIGVAKLPPINGKQMTSFSGVKVVGVNAYSRYPKAAMLLARYATSEAGQLLNYQKQGVLPTNSKIAANKAVKSDAIVQGFLAQLKTAEPMPSIASMGAVWSPMGAAVADVWDKDTDPKTALTNAVTKIKKAIQK